MAEHTLTMLGRVFDLENAPEVSEGAFVALSLTADKFLEYAEISDKLIPRDLTPRSRVRLACVGLDDKEVVFTYRSVPVKGESSFLVELRGVIC